MKESYTAQNSLELNPLQILPTILYRIKNFLPPKKGMDAKTDYVQLPADPSLWPVSGIPCPS